MKVRQEKLEVDKQEINGKRAAKPMNRTIGRKEKGRKVEWKAGMRQKRAKQIIRTKT